MLTDYLACASVVGGRRGIDSWRKKKYTSSVRCLGDVQVEI